jgi:uncharacterized protein with PQ loop repeat
MIEFAEIREFGINLLTLSFIATMVFTALQAIAFLKQNQRIIKTKSGQSVSFSFYSFFGFSALAVTVFGLTNQSLALSINGLLGILSLIITINLLRFKKISKKEMIIGGLSILALPTMIFSPNRDAIFLALGLIIGATLGIQVIEIWKNKSSGSYHPTQIFVSIASCSFWLIYSIIMNIWAMEITNSLFLSLWFILLFSYLKFRNK